MKPGRPNRFAWFLVGGGVVLFVSVLFFMWMGGGPK